MAQRSCCTLTLTPCTVFSLTDGTECDHWLWYQEEGQGPVVMLTLIYLPKSDLNNPLSILVWVLRVNNSRPSSLEEENLNHKVSKPNLNLGIMFMPMKVPFQKITLHVS